MPCERPNPATLLVLVALAGCVLLALANYHQHRLVQWIVEDTAQVADRLAFVLTLLAVAGVLPIGFLAGYAAWTATRVVRSGRFPPPGVRILRRGPVREGAQALRAARVLQLVAAVLSLLALGIPVVFWRLAETLVPG